MGSVRSTTKIQDISTSAASTLRIHDFFNCLLQVPQLYRRATKSLEYLFTFHQIVKSENQEHSESIYDSLLFWLV